MEIPFSIRIHACRRQANKYTNTRGQQVHAPHYYAKSVVSTPPGKAWKHTSKHCPLTEKFQDTDWTSSSLIYDYLSSQATNMRPGLVCSIARHMAALGRASDDVD